MLDPAAYVQRVKIASEAKQQITTEDVEQAALTRTPNYRHRDGRIYASRPGEPYFAVTVSPLNPMFDSQIEPGIAPVVHALLEKNYLPVSSCQGHGDSRAFVRIAFGSEDSRDQFVQEFGTMEYVTLSKLKYSANVVQYWEQGRPKWRALYESETVRRDLEAVDVNYLYRKNYQTICYADITLYETKQGIWHFFSRQRMINDLHRNKSRRIQMIVDRIKSMQEYLI